MAISDQDIVLTGDIKGYTILLDIEKKTTFYKRNEHFNSISAVKFWPHSNQIFSTTSFDGKVLIYDTRAS